MSEEKSELLNLDGKEWRNFTDTLKVFMKEKSQDKDFEKYYEGMQVYLSIREAQKASENPPKCAWIGAENRSWSDVKFPEINKDEDKLEPKTEGDWDIDEYPYVMSSIKAESPGKSTWQYIHCRPNKRIGIDIAHYKGKIENPAMQYALVWIGACAPDAHAKTQVICRMTVEFLAEFINDLIYVLQPEIDEWIEHCKSFDYMEAYKNAVFRVYGLPKEEFIKRVAAERYETRENNAMLWIADSHTVSTIKSEKEYISFVNSSEYKLVMNKTSAIRKMLEVCNDGKGILLATCDEEGMPLAGALMRENIPAEFPNEIYFQFLGRGGWKLFVGKDCILMYKNLCYYADGSYSGDDILERIKGIGSVKAEDKKALCEILMRLWSEQYHGGLLIIEPNAKKEARRFSNCKRGMLVEAIDLKEKENLVLLDGMASIDGAVMLDFAGICYGFGIILDGKAKKGDVGRGARYNSAISYITGDIEKYAVIVSEDKERGLEIIDNHGNKL